MRHFSNIKPHTDVSAGKSQPGKKVFDELTAAIFSGDLRDARWKARLAMKALGLDPDMDTETLRRLLDHVCPLDVVDGGGYIDWEDTAQVYTQE